MELSGQFKLELGGQYHWNFHDESGSVEIIINNQTGAEKHILYIGGTPYDANIILVKDYNSSTANYHFLHKDYIGSILAITDQNGTKVEQRHFDAWGNITHLKQGNNAIITDVSVIAQTALFLDRGYTSHEHFQELGIIHMNGRLYDPILRRFLNADENIQDPMNTQNYNKYGYVFNNPLMYNDPSGEFLIAAGLLGTFWATIFTGAVVGAGVGLVSYSLSVAISGQKWNIGGALKGVMWGAISGAVTAGIGNAFSTAASGYTKATEFAEKFIGGVVKAGAHAVSQGTLSIVQGGSFYQAFVSGAVGSLAASGWEKLGKIEQLNNSGNFVRSTVGMVTFSAFSGGIGSSLVGGNFWEGFVIGGTVAGLNHALHKGLINKSDLITNLEEAKNDPDFFERLRQHYESGTGETLILTKEEFLYLMNKATSEKLIDYSNAKCTNGQCTAIINFYKSDNDLKLSFGRATVKFYYDKNGYPHLNGFYDKYDFDPKPWGTRSRLNEAVTRAYNLYSSGKAFEIIYP